MGDNAAAVKAGNRIICAGSLYFDQNICKFTARMQAGAETCIIRSKQRYFAG